MDPSSKQIPPERKNTYYFGMMLTGLGLLMFLSTFVSGCMNFGNQEIMQDHDKFTGHVRSQATLAIGGMVLFFIGGIMMSIGASGWSGSGVVLDPEKARKDMEPWNRMAGGMVQDALSEVDVVKKLEERLEPSEPHVKVRCQQCRSLNDETAKFCNQCGAAI